VMNKMSHFDTFCMSEILQIGSLPFTHTNNLPDR
jgi:hypothetical protein